jgi:hypothetical protein
MLARRGKQRGEWNEQEPGAASGESDHWRSSEVFRDDVPRF